MIGRLLREPLLHFLLIGAALFGLYRLANPGSTADAARRIVVSAGRIDQLASLFTKTWQRPPEPTELKGLIDEYILEEIYYRRAQKMGLDRDDVVIRRRLRQKLEFLTEDAAALLEPEQEELARYLAANQDRFRDDSSYTFRQLYFNPARHGEDPEGLVGQRLVELNAGREVEADPTLIPESFAASPRRAVDSTFGRGFSARLDELPEGVWSGPVRSGLGLHLIRIESRTPGRLPELAEIRNAVAREWANDKRLETKKGVNDRLLEDYEIVIEWPEAES